MKRCQSGCAEVPAKAAVNTRRPKALSAEATPWRRACGKGLPGLLEWPPALASPHRPQDPLTLLTWDSCPPSPLPLPGPSTRDPIASQPGPG